MKDYKSKKKDYKEKGSFLIEILVTISIALLFFNFLFMKYNTVKEKEEVRRAVHIFETTIHRYSIKSLGTQKNFYINFNYNNKTITIKDVLNETVFEEIKLPKKPSYLTVFQGCLQRNIKFYIKHNGNLSKAFSVYIFDGKGKVNYRVSYYIFQQSHILKINTYKYIGKKEITSKNLIKFHYKEDSKDINWLKL